MLQRLRPVMPCAPKALNRMPPTIAPTMPSSMSSIMPSPRLLTILLPINPATRPNMIQPMIDIDVLHSVGSDILSSALKLSAVERIAVRRRARLEPRREPPHALLRRAVGEGIRNDVTLRLFLQHVVTDG